MTFRCLEMPSATTTHEMLALLRPWPIPPVWAKRKSVAWCLRSQSQSTKSPHSQPRLAPPVVGVAVLRGERTRWLSMLGMPRLLTW